MLYQEIAMHQEGSLPGAKLVLYIQDYSESMQIQARPLVLLCPGGGYGHTSDRESESEALQFLAMGCHAAVLRYSVVPAKYPTQLLELAFSMMYIRQQAKEWHIDENRIIVQGSSAGGHLAGCLGVFWKEDWLRKAVGAADSMLLKPNGMLLCYPVITSGEFAHKPSFVNLVGNEEELIKRLSLENQVNGDTPQTFIWHTFTDGSVPVENSLLFVCALRKNNISTEFHLYPKGHHGLALASPLTASADGGHVQKECESWIELARIWIDGLQKTE